MNIVLPRESVTYDGPNIVVCEGYADAQFIKHLLNIRHLERFDIGCPTQDQEEVGADGRSGMADYLKAVGVNISRAQHGLRSIAVVLDSDADPARAFADARHWLASTGFPTPDEAFQWSATEGGVPRTAIALIPGFTGEGSLRPGTLEHLLWDVLRDSSPDISRCVEDFAGCLGPTTEWSSNEQLKMRVHAAIAGKCQKDPASSLSRVWSNDPELFPLSHTTFDFLANMFRQVV